MGSPLAPVLAELYLNKFEDKYINEKFHDIIFCYRYLVDIFILIKDSMDVYCFVSKINIFDSNLKFTFEIENNNKINFVDILIFRIDDKYLTRWYRKNSNTYTFQNFTSQSTEKYKIQLIYTMVSRLKRICSTKDLLELDVNLLKMSFRYSGYPESIIRKHFNKSLNYRKVVKNDVPKKVFYFGIQYLNSY